LRERIELEERYRNDVRKALEDQETRPKRWQERWLAFFNSAFGLWFLSTVAVGGLTYAWTSLQAGSIARHVRADEIRRLDLEIMYRLAALQPTILTAGSIDEKEAFQHVANTSLDVPKPDNPEYLKNPAFPEYADTATTALIFRLLSLVEAHEKQEVETAMLAWMAVVRDFELVRRIFRVIAQERRKFEAIKWKSADEASEGEGAYTLSVQVFHTAIGQALNRSLGRMASLKLSRWKFRSGGYAIDLHDTSLDTPKPSPHLPPAVGVR